MWTKIASFFVSLSKKWLGLPKSTRWLILGCVACVLLGAGVARGYYKPRLDRATADAEYYRKYSQTVAGYLRTELKHLESDNRSIGAELEQRRLDNESAIAIINRAAQRAEIGLAAAAKYESLSQQNRLLYQQARDIVAALGEAYRTLNGAQNSGK